MKQTQTAPARALTGKLVAFSALGAYFAVLFVGGLINSNKLSVISPDFIIYFNPLTYAIAWLITTAVLLLYGTVSKGMVYGFAWVATLCYAVCTTVSGGDYKLTFAMCGLVALMTVLCGWARRTEPVVQKKKAARVLSPVGGKVTVGVAAALIGGGVILVAATSYLAYATMPSGSTAVYVQLMESLRSGHFFDTSIEFGKVVSHFGAHISPIFLLYLPFYAAIPSALTLIVLQTAAVYSAVIPLWLIARRRGLSSMMSATLCVLLCLYPAVWGGAVGMIHEYALLLPLLLWLFWALEARRGVLVWIFAALTLCVRETAAIHLLAIGLYWLIRNRRAEKGKLLGVEGKKALILSGAALGYFILAMVLLSTQGLGTLITRFDNVTGEYGFFFDTLLREIVYNPALIVYEMLTEQKLHYVLVMALPLCFLPILSGKKAGLVFLLPFLFLNLLADFSYHYNTDFPYSFGVSAIFFYLAVEALSRLGRHTDEGRTLRRTVTLALCFSVIVGVFCLSDYKPTMDYAFSEHAEIAAMNELLEAAAIDPDASVSASARLCPNLAARREIYTLSQGVETDVIVIDLRDEWGLTAEKTYDVAYFEKLGYKVSDMREGVGVVMVKQG